MNETKKVPLWRDLVALGKPGITLMCLIEAAGGMALASINGKAVATFDYTIGLIALIGTVLSVVCANTLNMVIEREGDRDMVRTKDRPLPSGRMKAVVALSFGIAAGVGSLVLLFGWVNAITGWIAVFAIVSYAGIYTPMKRKSWWSLIVGAFPGAVPPLMGWTAATGEMGAPGVVLFLILFIWQLPHFIAISFYRRHDYVAAGIFVLPEVRGDDHAKMQSLVYALLLFPVSLLLVPLGVAGFVYFTVASALGAWFFIFSVQGFEPQAGNKWARSFFLASLVYLPALTAALVIDVAMRRWL